MSSNTIQNPLVAICDAESKSLHHEEVNAAIVAKYLKQHAGRALLFSDTDHWQCLRKVYEQRLGQTPSVEHIPITPPIGSKDEAQQYSSLMSDVFKTVYERGIKHLLFTNTHFTGLAAVIDTMEQYPDVNITMIVHGQLDEHWFFNRWQRFRLSPMPLDKLMAASSHRIRFLTVSGHIEASLQKLGMAHVQSASLHHPYLWNNAIERASEPHRKIRLCCIGSINKDKSRRQMRKLARQLSSLDADFELVFFGKFRYRTSDSRITIHNRRFDKAEFDVLIPDFDFILQPYLENSYQLKASGILFDALNYQVPLITTQTAFTRYYFNLLGDIGCIAQNHQQLFTLLKSYIDDPVAARANNHARNMIDAKKKLSALNEVIEL